MNRDCPQFVRRSNSAILVREISKSCEKKGTSVPKALHFRFLKTAVCFGTIFAVFACKSRTHSTEEHWFSKKETQSVPFIDFQNSSGLTKMAEELAPRVGAKRPAPQSVLTQWQRFGLPMKAGQSANSLFDFGVQSSQLTYWMLKSVTGGSKSKNSDKVQEASAMANFKMSMNDISLANSPEFVPNDFNFDKSGPFDLSKIIKTAQFYLRAVVPILMDRDQSGGLKINPSQASTRFANGLAFSGYLDEMVEARFVPEKPTSFLKFFIKPNVWKEWTSKSEINGGSGKINTLSALALPDGSIFVGPQRYWQQSPRTLEFTSPATLIKAWCAARMRPAPARPSSTCVDIKDEVFAAWFEISVDPMSGQVLEAINSKKFAQNGNDVSESWKPLLSVVTLAHALPIR
jgi:hypothetical protein